MERKIAGLIGAAAAIGAVASPAAAAPAPTDVLQANSYADLLQPIPNASTKLEALDAQASEPAEKPVQLAQFYYHHHHHHHHHGYWHHHHHGYYGPRVVVVPPRFRHHHHHHHHHHGYWER